MESPVRAIGYVRVSTDEQQTSGAGISAQRAAIRTECDRRSWSLLRIVGEDAGANSATLERAGLRRALDILDRGDAEVLLIAKLDRLSRSVAQGAQVMDRAKRKGWSLVALDFGLDTTTPAGEMVANVILSTAQYERRLIGQRTRDALAAKREQGVRLGRPQALPDDVVQRIVAARQAGSSFRVIASQLEMDGVPTARGGPTWHASSVRAVCESQAAARAELLRQIRSIRAPCTATHCIALLPGEPM
jgi:DNA invertase Pin-like site-specific DNA recombinase